MIKKYAGYEEKATAPMGQLPPGCYVVTIKAVKYVEGVGTSDKIEMAVDIAEGEQAGFFQDQYNASTDEDKKWKGKATIWMPEGTGTDADKRSVRNFNSFAAYLANANTGYHWDWDETKLKGKKIGAAFRKEYNVINGREVSYTAFAWFCDVEDVRSGKAKTPNERYRNGATGNVTPAATSSANDGFLDIPANAEEEGFPF